MLFLKRLLQVPLQGCLRDFLQDFYFRSCFDFFFQIRFLGIFLVVYLKISSGNFSNIILQILLGNNSWILLRISFFFEKLWEIVKVLVQRFFQRFFSRDFCKKHSWNNFLNKLKTQRFVSGFFFMKALYEFGFFRHFLWKLLRKFF